MADITAEDAATAAADANIKGKLICEVTKR
jgi:hypothetical protein